MFDTSEFDIFGVSHPTELGTWDTVTSSTSISSDSDQESNFGTFIDQLFSTNIDMNPDPTQIGFYDGVDGSQSEHAAFSGEGNIGIEGTVSETIESEWDAAIRLISPDIIFHPNAITSENLSTHENEVAVVKWREHDVAGSRRIRPNRPGEFVFALEGLKKRYYPFSRRLDLQNRRRNKKPVEVGNNAHGRAGRPRCVACRRRKAKVLPIRNLH